VKILYIGTTDTTEFMADTVFHGLRSILGTDVVDAYRMDHMYEDCTDNLLRYHGRGFTTTKLLRDDDTDRWDIQNKIVNRYFDYVIYGAIYRERRLIDLVLDHYPNNRIAVIDGHDKEPNACPELLGRAVYFKRERSDDHPRTRPISFSIPAETIVANECVKTDCLMPLVPGVLETYIYNSTHEYYKAYQQALYGLTWKKAGWDCLRHYEILSQGCVPLFLDIHHMPRGIMQTYPKRLIEVILAGKAFSLPGYDPMMKFEYNHYNAITNLDFSHLEIDTELTDWYLEIRSDLLQWTRKRLTTAATAQYILDTMGNLQ
jgi:hypothetical protein